MKLTIEVSITEKLIELRHHCSECDDSISVTFNPSADSADTVVAGAAQLALAHVHAHEVYSPW